MARTPLPSAELSDPYRLHRIALAPLTRRCQGTWLLENLGEQRLDGFFDWLESQGLSQFWRDALAGEPVPVPLEDHLERLRDQARLTAAHQMIQRVAMGEIAAALDSEDIGWFLFKGADLREWLYPDPTVRPVSDIDIFVHPSDRQKAVALLKEAGFVLHVRPENASHEVTLDRHNISLDLHWHLFRPSRARPGLSDWLMQCPESHAGFNGLDATASALVMLVHPVITKYLLSPTSLLIHQVDQACLINSGEIDWAELESALKSTGTSVAAWCALYALRMLTGIEAPHNFMQRIQPGRIHRRYLGRWIDRAWILNHFDRPLLVKGLFSLALQDSFPGAARAFAGAASARIHS